MPGMADTIAGPAGRPHPGRGPFMRKPNALFLPAALAVVLAAGGCSPAPGPGGGAGSAPACATPAAPYLKPAGRAAGGIRWVVRLASCFPGDKTEPSGL